MIGADAKHGRKTKSPRALGIEMRQPREMASHGLFAPWMERLAGEERVFQGSRRRLGGPYYAGCEGSENGTRRSDKE